MSEVVKKDFEMEMQVLEVKGLIRETEKTLRSTNIYLVEPEEMNCLDLANVVKNLDKCQHMLTFIKDKAMQIMDKK